MSGSHSAITTAAKGGVAVTPSDVTEIPVTRSLWVGVTGNVAVRHPDGTTPTYTNVPVGFFAVQCDKVLATGTTATGIVAVY